jgi:hypothetical protein
MLPLVLAARPRREWRISKQITHQRARIPPHCHFNNFNSSAPPVGCADDAEAAQNLRDELPKHARSRK